MAKISLRILSAVLISGIVFFFNFDNSKSCGYDYNDDSLVAGLFEPNIIKDETLSAFFLSESFFADYSSQSLLNPEVENIQQWQKYFNNVFSYDDIKNVLYRSTLEEIQLLKFTGVNKKNIVLTKRFAKSSLANSFNNGDSPDALEYIVFAKECEPHVIDNRNYSWNELLRDTIAMKTLLDKGQLLYAGCNNNVLKVRYAYQCVRLAHYLKNYDLTIRLFDDLVAPLNTESFIYYWALSHKAGAIRSKGDIAYSSYLFSTIFDKCLSRRLIASQNFKSLESSLLLETLDYCKDNHEKTAVWFLHAYLTDDFGSVKKIYELEPNSRYLEILLTRAIDKLENDIVEYWNRDKNTNWSNQFIRLDYPNFYSFISSCAKKENTHKPYFWYYAAGYISMLRQDFYAMRENFKEAKRLLPKDETEYFDRIKILEILSKVDEQEIIDEIFEANILNDVKWVLDLKKYNSDNAFSWMMKRFSEKYYKQQDTAKAQMCLGFRLGKGDYTKTVSWFDYLSNPGSAPLDKVIRFVESDYNRTAFDKYLIENFCYSKKDLYEIRGTLLLSKYDFENALLWNFSNIKNELSYLPADPFLMNINDCHKCDAKVLISNPYTKHSFTKRMVELEKEVKTNPKNRAENFYLLANAYYNMTYFGNSWMIVDFYRSLTSEVYSPNYLDCSKAEDYYLKAMTISNDVEFQARCLFMAAKCEQNRFYVDKGFFQGSIEYYPYDCEPNPKIKKENYRMYFKNLKDKYSKTEFYKQSLKECKYFNSYVTTYAK